MDGNYIIKRRIKMSDSSSGGIGIGTIIFCIIIYNVFFGDDDKNKDVKEIDVKTQDEYVSDETKKEIKENIKNVVTSAKKAFEEAEDKLTKKQNEKEAEDKLTKKQNEKEAEDKLTKKLNEKIETNESMEKDKLKKGEFKRL
jgi:hypothetical protein